MVHTIKMENKLRGYTTFQIMLKFMQVKKGKAIPVIG
jgi:hypothetical protein